MFYAIIFSPCESAPEILVTNKTLFSLCSIAGCFLQVFKKPRVCFVKRCPHFSPFVLVVLFARAWCYYCGTAGPARICSAVFSCDPLPLLACLSLNQNQLPRFRSAVGSPTWTRTTDHSINSRRLYQLSYRGMLARGGSRTRYPRNPSRRSPNELPTP